VLFTIFTSFEVFGSSSAEVCVADDLHRQVCVKKTPGRTVSFAPSLTEVVFALNAGDLLVGRTRRCNYPEAALKVREIGAYMRPDLERVIGLRPDLVITTKDGARAEAIERLADLGVPVFIDDSRSLDDVCHMVARLGRLLSREAEAFRIIGDIQQRRRKISARLGTANRPSVLLAVGTRPLVVAGGESFIGALIREAGGANVAEYVNFPFPRLSMEEVITKDPEIILVLDKECRGTECSEEWRRHHLLKAVKSNRIYALDADVMARCSPRIIEALEQLARLFHPSLFAGPN
jgi:iron complex transport system substrate-binding protein